MAKKKTEKKDATALTAPVIEQNGIMRLNIKAFEPALQKQVIGLMEEMQSAITDIARSHLKIGSILSKARLLLEARGGRVFVAFINEIPGLSTSTAYRYMEAFDIAKERFPETILNRILAASLPMIGNKDNPFGKYTEVINKKGLLPPSGASEAQADDWIRKVQKAYTDFYGKRQTRLPDPTKLQQEAFNAVNRRFNRLAKKNVAWLTNLFAFVAGANGIKSPMTVDPKDPPSGWLGKDAEEETEKDGKKE